MKVVLELVQFWKQMIITIGSIFTRLPYMEWMPRLGPHLCGGPLSIIYYYPHNITCNSLGVSTWALLHSVAAIYPNIDLETIKELIGMIC